jgi:cobalt-zinc-cadmium efflux system membrane fusion protein
MDVRKTKTIRLLIILAALGASGMLGWWFIQPDHDHDQHAGHNHNQHAGHDHSQHAGHDHDREDQSCEPETPHTGQVHLTPEAVQLANIKTSPVLSRALEQRVSFVGELVFNEERLAKIRSRAPGRVVRIVADYGQVVKPGSVLAIIESVELSLAHMASRQAAAKMAEAQKAYDRAGQLYEGKAISRAELQERQARLEVERAELENAQNRLRLLGAGGDTLTPGGKIARSGDTGSQTVSSGTNLALRSPIAGRVVERRVTPGLVIKEDEELFTIADTAALWCFVQIPEKDLPLVQVGAPAVITVNSLPQREFPGRLDYLADLVDKATRTIRGRVRVDNPHNLLKAGMFANISLRAGQRAGLSIPESAVQTANGEVFVLVETGSGVYQKRLIKTGAKGDGRVEVLEGLKEGEPVVGQGGFTLKSELEKGAFQGCGSGHAH